MLMLVRDSDTPALLATRRAAMARTVAEMAAAPVAHVPTAFLLAVEGLFPVQPHWSARQAAQR